MKKARIRRKGGKEKRIPKSRIFDHAVSALREGRLDGDSFFRMTDDYFISLAVRLRRLGEIAGLEVDDIAQQLRVFFLECQEKWNCERGTSLAKFSTVTMRFGALRHIEREQQRCRKTGKSRRPLLLLDAVEREESELNGTAWGEEVEDGEAFLIRQEREQEVERSVRYLSEAMDLTLAEMNARGHLEKFRAEARSVMVDEIEKEVVFR